MSATEEIVSEKLSRRNLLTRFGAAGVGVAATAMLAGCGGSSSSSNGASTNQQILNAAATAEALATVMYYNIIHTSPLYSTGLAGNLPDQAYLQAGLEQEANHYYTLVAAGAVPLTTTFYFPTNMFSDATYATTVNYLVHLEYAFIAAYLIGVRDFSSSSLRVLASQIMGVEAEHRTLARVIANDVGLTSVPDLAGIQEGIPPPSHTSNNISYERTYSSVLPNIQAVVTALAPFVSTPSTGFSTTPYAFNTTANFYSTTSPVTQDQTTP